MEQSPNGFRTLLEGQVEALQDELYLLERDPDDVERLKSILRSVQTLRRARPPEEPETVRMLRNAVEKVTLHIGRADLAVSQDFLDFYTDTFDLLEDAVRRWPAGPSLDVARYADRVRGLLDTTAPRRAAFAPAPGQVEAPDVGEAAEPAALEAEALLAPEIPDEIVLAPEAAAPEAGRAATEAPAVTEISLVAEATAATEIPAAGIPAETGIGSRPAETEIPAAPVAPGEPGPEAESIELVRAEDLTIDERETYVAVDLRDLLAEPWRARPGRVPGPPGQPAPAPAAGGLAASFASLETLRAEPPPAVREESAAEREMSTATRAAVDRLRNALDAFSLSCDELEGASDRLRRVVAGDLDAGTATTLVERIEVERRKLLAALDRTVESVRAGAS